MTTQDRTAIANAVNNLGALLRSKEELSKDDIDQVVLFAGLIVIGALNDRNRIADALEDIYAELTSIRVGGIKS